MDYKLGSTIPILMHYLGSSTSFLFKILFLDPEILISELRGTEILVFKLPRYPSLLHLPLPRLSLPELSLLT